MSELLFTIGPEHMRFDYFRGSGKGGQKRNKTSSGVRCTHIESGAVGVSDDTRSQHTNKLTAFHRMAATERFKAWHRMEVAKRTGVLAMASDYAEREIKRVVVEVKKDGRWVPEQLTKD